MAKKRDNDSAEATSWEQQPNENGELKFKNAVSNAEFLRDMELQLQQILKALD